MWGVVIDYVHCHRIVDEDGNTIASIQPNYNFELELENGDSGDPNLETLKMIVKKHNQIIKEMMNDSKHGN
jgi:hypothetical protein